jgi:hypothetical protein
VEMRSGIRYERGGVFTELMRWQGEALLGAGDGSECRKGQLPEVEAMSGENW